MKRVFFIIFFLAAAGVAASLLLIPRASEIALIRYKDKQFDAARTVYEEQFKQGNVSPEVVNTLVDLYLQSGDVAGAVSVMEHYIAQHPADIEARKRLGQLYQFAERPDDYLKNLEEINRLQPSAETLKSLSQIYNYNADYAKQAEALKQLIALSGDATPSQAYTDLANILATQKNAAGAIDALNALKTKHADTFTFREEELLVSLLLDEHRVDDALAEAKIWRAKNPPAAESARLINMLHLRGTPQAGQALLATYDDSIIAGENSLLAEKILLMMNGGHEAEAYAQLTELYGKGFLSADMKNRLLFLAISRGDEDTAQKLLAELDVTSLNEQQALSLLELSVARGDASMQKRLSSTFGTDAYRAQYPLLSAMISVISRTADAKDKLRVLLDEKLTPQQNLQVARICIRMKDYGCSERFLSRLPDAEALSDAEVASVGELYYELGAYDKGYTFINRMAEKRNTSAINDVRIKFAAVKGDTKAVDAWLNENGKNASNRQLTDLFFAARNHRQPALSGRIAERLYAREQNATTRSMLASSYVSAGQYAKAVSLLRQNRELTEADESNYLAALSKLARTNPSYRAELGVYAASRLNTSISEKRKLAIIYAAVQGGNINIVLPHVRTLALKEGGKWAWFYADELTKQGKFDEARDFWVQLAHQPSTSPRQRRQIAYNLLAGGYGNDAEPIFREIAATSAPDSENVRALLYVWGPRLQADQLEWLAQRFQNSRDENEALQWAGLIANYSSGDELIPFAETQHPEILFAPAVWKSYIAALARTGQLPEKHAALLQASKELGDAELLRIYAKTAQAYDYKRESREAYEAVFAIAPEDNDTLRELGLIAFNQADYQASALYLSEYLNGPAANDTPANGASAYFYYGELVRRDRKLKDAVPYYERTIELADASPEQTTDLLAKKAQSLIFTGREAEGLALFQQTAEANPENDLVRADWATALLEQKHYDETRALIAEPITRLSQPAPEANSLIIPAGLLANHTMLNSETEALLSLNGKDDDLRQFASNAQTLPWISYTSVGYHEVLVAAKPGYTMQVENINGEMRLTPISAATDEARRQMRLRYELIAARADLETGKILASTQRLNALLPEYPNDAQLLGFTANAEYYGGNWARAQSLLKTAKAIAPENADVALLSRDINRARGNGVKLDHEWVKRGNDYENITTLSGLADVGKKVKVGLTVQNDYVEARNIRRANGRVGNYDRHRQRTELFAIFYDEDGRRLKTSLFANNDTPGGAVYYEWLNRLGESGAGAEYHRPNWDYVEGVLDSATRDRISLWHTIKPSTRFSVRLEPGLNRYNVEDHGNTATTWSLDASVVYRPIESMPYLYLAYGLSAEYMIDKNLYVDSFGTAYKRLPVNSREVHFISVNTGYDFDAQTYGSLMLGYGYDRLGGNGPLIEGRITREFTDELDAQLRAGYGLDTQQSGNNVTRLGGYLRYRF